MPDWRRFLLIEAANQTNSRGIWLCRMYQCFPKI